MNNVLIDLHRVGKNRFNGLYTYCYHLGLSLLKFPTPGIKLFFYVPDRSFGLFGNKVNYLEQRSADKFYRFNTSKYKLWHATTTLSWYKPFNHTTKFVFTIHDLNFLLEKPNDLKRNKRILQQIQTRVDRADELVIISKFAHQQAQEHLHLGNKPVTIIYPGCALLNEEVFPVIPKYVPAKPFLFAIGLLIPRKNFHVLIPLLQGNDYELIIAGMNESGYKEKIIEQAKKYGVLNRVKLVGSVTDQEKVWYYQHCEAFMFPSFAEGFGSPTVEAMHYGKPVFLSRETSLPEIGGDVAYYFDSFAPEDMKKNFEEGMEHYHKTKAQEMIKERSSLFTYENAAREHLVMYQRILLK